jgi:hypothetical protein
LLGALAALIVAIAGLGYAGFLDPFYLSVDVRKYGDTLHLRPLLWLDRWGDKVTDSSPFGARKLPCTTAQRRRIRVAAISVQGT